MLRKLLTLLAICAGLAAVGEPARAAVTAVESVHMVERSGSACAAIAASHLAASLSPVQRIRQAAESHIRPALGLRVPTVMLRVDRARE